MFKKFSIVAVGVLAAMFVLSYTRVGSYMCTGLHKMRHQAENKIPLEFELETLKHELTRLDKDIDAARTPVAEQMVKVDELRDVQLPELRARVEKQRKEAARLLSFIKDETQTTFVLQGREIKRDQVDQVKTQLDSKVKTGNLLVQELASKERQLKSMERARDKAVEQLDAMASQREKFKAEIARLEADVKELRLAQTESKVAVDDSRLSNFKERMAQIEHRIKVEKTKVDLVGKYAPSTEDKPVKDVIGDADDFINGGSK